MGCTYISYDRHYGYKYERHWDRDRRHALCRRTTSGVAPFLRVPATVLFEPVMVAVIMRD